MMRRLGAWFWVEAAAAALCVLLLVLTVVWKDWVEIVFRVDPDHHSGWLESAIVLACITVTVGLSALARLEWRRAAATA